MIKQQKKNRLLILIIFGMSIIPFLMAWGLKENPALLTGKTNHGQLITSPIITERSDFAGFDTFSADNLTELPGHWLIANVIPTSHCNEHCLDALLKTRQLRLMLNKDLPRTRRIVMIYDRTIAAEVASQWWLKDALLWRLRGKENKDDDLLFSHLLSEENSIDDALVAKLVGKDKHSYALNSDLIRVVPNEALQKKIAELRQGEIPDGMLLLIDPLGNIMMQYQPGFDPYQVKSDLMHLLRISQIG